MNDVHAPDGTTYEEIDNRNSVGQFVAAAIGFVFVVFGGIALARLGFNGSITGETTSVVGFEATRLWAIIEVALGLIFLGMAVSAQRVRSGLITMGLLLSAFGVVVAAEAGSFEESLGVSGTAGIAFVILGVLLIAIGWFAPRRVPVTTV